MMERAACAGLILVTSPMCTDLLYRVMDTEEWTHLMSLWYLV